MSEEQQSGSQAEQISTSAQEKLKLLKQTLERLESIVQDLEKQPPENLPSLEELDTLAITTEKLAATLTPIETESPNAIDSRKIIEEEEEKVFSPEKEVISPPQIEQELPSPQGKAKTFFDKRILISVVSVVIIAVLVGLSQVIPWQKVDLDKLPPITINFPQELETPATPPEEEEEEYIAPELEILPQQTLIAAIQEEVAEITNRYAEGLVLSLEANFVGSRLIVTVSDDWEQLKPQRQIKIANEILSRSRQLDFKKLEILNQKGELLARSPVVGNNMVILEQG